MREKEYFKCYSWKLKNFIQAHGVYPLSSGVNARTNNVYHIFRMTDELSRILTNWSAHKQDK